MADVIKIGDARKRIAKRDRERQAADNRAKFGLSKTERRRQKAEQEQRDAALDQHRLEEPQID